MPKLLANSHVLANVVPIVVDQAQHERAKVRPNRLAVDDHRLLQRGCRDGVQPRVGGLSYRAPSFLNFVEGWCAARCAVSEKLIYIGHKHLPLGASEPVTLLLPGEVPYVPGDAIHRLEAASRLLVRNAHEGALELVAG